jgi:aspartyl-tRNA(Asn)/glutamyl-tRNA(Gln) amidotransferase subunit B
MTGQNAEDVAAVSADLDVLVGKAVDENPEVLEDYRKNEKAANRIIGSVMKQSGGKYSSADVVSAVKRVIESRL